MLLKTESVPSVIYKVVDNLNTNTLLGAQEMFRNEKSPRNTSWSVFEYRNFIEAEATVSFVCCLIIRNGTSANLPFHRSRH